MGRPNLSLREHLNQTCQLILEARKAISGKRTPFFLFGFIHFRTMWRKVPEIVHEIVEETATGNTMNFFGAPRRRLQRQRIIFRSKPVEDSARERDYNIFISTRSCIMMRICVYIRGSTFSFVIILLQKFIISLLKFAIMSKLTSKRIILYVFLYVYT